MSGFIDPDAGRDGRIDRLEALIDLVLPTISLDVLSPEARAVVEDLSSGDRERVARGREAYRRSYTEAERAHRAAPPAVPADGAGGERAQCARSGCTCSCHGLMGGSHVVPCCDRVGQPLDAPSEVPHD